MRVREYPGRTRGGPGRAEEGLGMPVHPHMLRHGCGFKLANQGDRHATYPGLHESLQHREHGDLHRDRTTTIPRLLEGSTLDN